MKLNEPHLDLCSRLLTGTHCSISWKSSAVAVKSGNPEKRSSSTKSMCSVRWDSQVFHVTKILTSQWHAAGNQLHSITLTRIPIAMASPSPVVNTPSYEKQYIYIYNNTLPWKKHKNSNHSLVMLSILGLSWWSAGSWLLDLKKYSLKSLAELAGSSGLQLDLWKIITWHWHWHFGHSLDKIGSPTSQRPLDHLLPPPAS